MEHLFGGLSPNAGFGQAAGRRSLTQALGGYGEPCKVRIKLATAFVACLAGCASGQTRSPIDLRTVVSDPAEYAGERIAVHACINVIVHGVALLPCGERRPNVDIKASDTGDGHYADLVRYAHQNMGASPEELPVVVVGVFRDSATAQEPLHSITVEQFIPQVSP